MDRESGLFIDVVEKLLKFGLAKNEAKAYVALLSLREGTGESITRLSGIARQEAYRVASNLEELGLVERIAANPTRFRPTPLQDGLSKLIKDEKEITARKILELEETQKEITCQFQHFGCTNEDVGSRTLILRNKRMFEREITLISEFKEKITLVACSRDLLLLQQYSDINLMRRLNGGNAKILCIDTLESYEEVEQAYGYLDLRYLEGFAGSMLVADGKRAVVKLEDRAALETNGAVLVKTIECIFEHLWQNALSTKEKYVQASTLGGGGGERERKK